MDTLKGEKLMIDQDRLRKAIKAAGYSLNSFEKLGIVSHAWLSGVCNGNYKKGIRYQTVKDVAEALGVLPDYLLGRSDQATMSDVIGSAFTSRQEYTERIITFMECIGFEISPAPEEISEVDDQLYGLSYNGKLIKREITMLEILALGEPIMDISRSSAENMVQLFRRLS